MTTRIILILDESGSMEGQQAEIVQSVNNMLKRQRALEPAKNDRVQFTLAKFSYRPGINITQSLSAFRFGPRDYQPDGSTALFDTIGGVLKQYKEEKNVVCVIVTDGMENASREYSYKQISDMVSDYQTQKNWKFVYLSENIDQFAQGCNIGFGCQSDLSNQAYTSGQTQSSIRGGTSNTLCNRVSRGMNEIQDTICAYRTTV